MVNYFLCFLLLLPVFSFSQIDTCFTKDEITKIAQDIKYNKDKVLVLSQLVDTLNVQLTDYSILIKEQKNYINLQNKEISFLGEQLEIALNNPKKDKWYNSKFMYYLGGMSAVLVGALAINLASK